METSKLIFTDYAGESPMLGMCSLCRTLFPAVTDNGADANREFLERCFKQHVNAEHSDHNLPRA
jgi:hypothetical protein